MAKVVCPGSFDPVTKGHLDIITRASGLFDEVIAVVVINPEKKPSFTAKERAAMLERVTAHLPNVSIDIHQGLLAEYVRAKGAVAIVKGLRAMSDFEYEFQMALMNRQLAPEIETFFIVTDPKYSYVSSSVIRDIFQFGGSIQDMVPPGVFRRLRERFPPQPLQ